MFSPRVFGKFLAAFLILLLAWPSIAQQLIDIEKFKGVDIPCQLIFENMILEKGKYDLEVLKNPYTPSCYLRITKGKKIICLIEGEHLDYEAYGMARMTDPNIPNEPRMKMKKDPQKKSFISLPKRAKIAYSPISC